MLVDIVAEWIEHLALILFAKGGRGIESWAFLKFFFPFS